MVGPVEWIDQVEDGVRTLVQRAFATFSRPAPARNMPTFRDGGRYLHPARTAAEVQAAPAATQGAVSRADRRRLQRFQQGEDTAPDVEAADPAASLAQPSRQPVGAQVILPVYQQPPPPPPPAVDENGKPRWII